MKITTLTINPHDPHDYDIRTGITNGHTWSAVTIDGRIATFDPIAVSLITYLKPAPDAPFSTGAR